MSGNDYQPNFGVRITPEQQRKLQKYLPHGVRKPLIGIILDDIIALCEEGRFDVMSALLKRNIAPREVFSILKDASDGYTEGS